MAIHKKCPKCGKLADVTGETRIGRKVALILACSHILVEEFVEVKETSDDAGKQVHEAELIRSLDEQKLHPYQVDFAKFAEEANIRVICADKFGLGKTVESLAVMKIHPESRPFVVVAKAVLLTQWAREIHRWTGLVPIIITDSNDVLDGFEAYVVSYDRLRRFKDTKDDLGRTEVGSGIQWLVDKLGLKTVILDECQQIKNTGTQRTVRVQQLVEKTNHVMALSGSPIENNTVEYFPVLNLMRPDLFPTEAGFIAKHVDYYWDGYKYRAGGLKNPSAFKTLTEKFIIRRSPEDVLDQFPSVSRNYRYCELEGKAEEAYIEQYKEFQKAMSGDDGLRSFESYSNALVAMSKMRHITGRAKVEPAADVVTEFLISNPQGKIVIFLHHLDVALGLKTKLTELVGKTGIGITEMSAALNMAQRAAVSEEFIGDPTTRILLASTGAAGEGLDGLQKVCSNCIVLERQWNPKKEENAEARLARLGQKEGKIVSTYVVAVGTIDEFFAELVERKRAVTSAALDGTPVGNWEETQIIKELASILLSKGGKKWRL